MGSLDMLNLRWDEYEPNIKQGFSQLRNDSDFYDVTLACGNNLIKAHKVILGACSSFFKSLIKSLPHQHPLLYLRGIDFHQLESILAFMYDGEVKIKPENLNSFLTLAQELKVNGLMRQQSLPKSQEQVASNKGAKRESSHVVSVPEKKMTNPLDVENITMEEVDPIESSSFIQTDPLCDEDTIPNESSGSIQTDAFSDMDSDHNIQEIKIEEEVSIDTNLSKNELNQINVILNARCSEFVSPRDADKNFRCLKCHFMSHKKHDVVRHVEARHFKTNGFPCDICGRRYKTRNSLTSHKIRSHKRESKLMSSEDTSKQDGFILQGP